jgi:hypothetical protein
MQVVENEALLSQVDRILRSEPFHSSEVLRRLLRFLADKSISGQANDLKEYAIAIDGLGKPTSYDPRHNSAVRIQVGRLRQRLAEYYRTDGKDDTFLIDLPKGRFQLTCELRKARPELLPESSLPSPEIAARPDLAVRRRLIPLTWLVVTMAATLAVYLFLAHEPKISAGSMASSWGWNADLENIWQPFMDSKKPIIVAIEDPLFVEMNSTPGIYYRDRSLNEWKDVAKSPPISALRKSVNNASIQPSRYYTAYGEVDVAFLLGRLLGPRVQNLSIIKTSQLSWQQLNDNNVVFAGVQNLFFDQQVHGMPLDPQLIPNVQGVLNVHPQPGENAAYLDHYSTAPTEEGVAYALVSHLPGPLRGTEVESFTSNRSAGYVGAVQWFTDPGMARMLVQKLSGTSGKMPRYYQVLLQVKFTDDVPTQTTYVLSHELH